MSKSNKQILSVIIAITCVLAYQIFSVSSIFKGLNSDADEAYESGYTSYVNAYVIPGDIVDSNLDYISYSDSDGERTCLQSYSLLVGYNSLSYGYYGLMYTYEQYLLYTYDEDNKGCTMVLTTDNDLQNLCYELLGDEVGSIIVLENSTGAILRLASREEVEFDSNNMSFESQAYYNAIDGYWLLNGVSESNAPGSVFKIITAAAAIEAGQEDFIYYDTGVYTTSVGYGITNFGDYAYGSLSLASAFAKSSNTYFSALGVEIGGEAIEEMASNFLLSETIELDFTTITSTFNIDYDDDFSITQTAIGQGEVAVSPMNIAMIVQAIANEGLMMTPYLIDEIYLGSKTLLESEPTELTQAVSSETANAVADIMIANGINNYGYSDGSVGIKSGTAELTDDGSINCIYLIRFTADYTILINQSSTTATSSSLKDDLATIIDYLV